MYLGEWAKLEVGADNFRVNGSPYTGEAYSEVRDWSP